jgi:hypothetical protein
VLQQSFTLNNLVSSLLHILIAYTPIHITLLQLEQVLQQSTIHHCNVHTLDETPDRWQIIPNNIYRQLPGNPVLVLCEPGYGITCVSCPRTYTHTHIVLQRASCKEYPKLPQDGITTDWFPQALSGYDNAAPQMKGIFLARGPGECVCVCVFDKCVNLILQHFTTPVNVSIGFEQLTYMQCYVEYYVCRVIDQMNRHTEFNRLLTLATCLCIIHLVCYLY